MSSENFSEMIKTEISGQFQKTASKALHMISDFSDFLLLHLRPPNSSNVEYSIGKIEKRFVSIFNTEVGG